MTNEQSARIADIERRSVWVQEQLPKTYRDVYRSMGGEIVWLLALIRELERENEGLRQRLETLEPG